MFSWCEWGITAVASAQNVNTRAMRSLGFIGSQLLGCKFLFSILSDFAFHLGFYLSMAEHLHPIP